MYDDYGNVNVPDEIVLNKKTDIFGEKIYEVAEASQEEILANIFNEKTKDDLETKPAKQTRDRKSTRLNSSH